MNLRIRESHWTSLVDALLQRQDVETAGVILAERLHGGVLLARAAAVVPEGGYIVRRGDQIRIDPITLNRMIRPARDRGMSIITIHTHPGTNQPWFSAADEIGDARLMPSFFDQMPGPHGSLVIAGETRLAAGRIWSDHRTTSDLSVQVVGKTLRMMLPLKTPIEPDAVWFQRQRLALGKTGQDILRRLHVVIVGLGGTGSVAFVQLAHLGVGQISIVDGDRVEESNVSRILGATAKDAGRTWKVDVAARYAEQLGLGTRVRCFRGHLGKEVSPADIEACDIALSCVDRHVPRALLNRLCYERALPLIDMGSAFRIDTSGKVVAGAGRVVIAGPGRPCLACWGHIDPNRMRIESLSETDRAREVADGYIEGADIAQPSVIAFNTAIAGASVVELLRLVTDFAGTDDPPMRLNFDFTAGTVRRNTLHGAGGCKICLPESSADDTLRPRDPDECLSLALADAPNQISS